MAESKISQYPFSPKHQKELASAHVEMLITGKRFLFGPPDRETELAAQILSRLKAGAKNTDSANDSTEPLPLDRVAKFLASLSQCAEAKLAATVKSGLRSLRIERPQRGRPRGRNADTLYATYVELVEDAIKDTGVFARKLEMQTRFGHNWQLHFRHFLQREKWPADSLHLVIKSSSPQILARYIVADEFNCSPDRIYRAIRAANSV